MRDANRIYPFCNEFAALWSNCPDLRFGQAVCIVQSYLKYEHKTDLFFIEDEELMKVLRECFGRGEEVRFG